MPERHAPSRGVFQGATEPHRHPTVGVDLGGTSLRAALYFGLTERTRTAAANPSAPVLPTPAAVRREPVGEVRDPESIAERIVRMVAELSLEAGVSGRAVPIGVGIAGMPGREDGFIVRSPHLDWTDVPFGALLRGRAGPDTRIRVVNDVNAIAYGEFALGAGAGARDILAVYVGTGIGGGLVCNGQLVEGADGCAGEIGHAKVVLGPEGRPCACGGTGCVEAYAGGRSLGRRIRAAVAAGALIRARELAGSSEPVGVAEVDRAASEGDPEAAALWGETAMLLGGALANAVALLNPERLILGGGVLSRTPTLVRETVAAMRRTGIQAAVAPLDTVPAMLGDDAGMVGAALLAETAET